MCVCVCGCVCVCVCVCVAGWVGGCACIRKPSETEVTFRKPGRIMMGRFFNELVEYFEGLIAIEFIHEIEKLVQSYMTNS